MKKIAGLVLLLLLAAAAFTLYSNRVPLLTALAERYFSFAGAEYLDGPVRLKRVVLDRSLKVSVEGIEAVLKTENGNFPFEISRVQSRQPLYRVLSQDGLTFDLAGVRPLQSPRQGVEGTFVVRAGPKWFSKAELRVHEIGLEDVRWLNPENLDGASGAMKGSITFGSNYLDQIGFSLDLSVAKPGGQLQERFFQTLRPYLPALPLKQGQVLVGYDEADLRMNLESADKIKGFLHIRVPEYNLNLNLNLEIRLDEENAFSKLFWLMGLIRVQT